MSRIAPSIARFGVMTVWISMSSDESWSDLSTFDGEDWSGWCRARSGDLAERLPIASGRLMEVCRVV